MKQKHKIDNDIKSLIKDYLNIAGMSISALSSISGVKTRSLNSYLNEGADIGSSKLEKILDALNIDLMQYRKRMLFVRRVATKLIEVKVTDVSKLSKKQIIVLSGEKDIELLLDANSEKYKRMLNSGLIDISCTYQYFHSLLSLFFIYQKNGIDNSISSLNAKHATEEFAKMQLNRLGEIDKNLSSEEYIEVKESFSSVAKSETKLGGAMLFSTIGAVSLPLIAAGAFLTSWIFSDDD